ncbi:MAG TPA: M14 family metallopeptidase, partial [Roseiflexaceae bacterium]|nr:M14 family metallopeptidase [Roseiflexaceae bacterium]
EQRSAIAATGAAIDGVGASWVDITATPRELQRLAALGFDPRALPAPSDFPPADSAYHNYEEMVADIGAVAAAHPSTMGLFSIGRSYEGRELWAAKISDNVQDDEDEPEALFVGHYHAREHLTVEMMLYILHMLADEYGVAGHEQITSLVDSREIYLIFDLNPDGGEHDIATGTYRWWRKNRQPNFDGTIGIDLNRNHGYRWGGLGASEYPDSETYRGPGPRSAPEVAAIEDFVNSRSVAGVQQITVAITFHTYGELVLWPYGYTYQDLPEDMQPDDLATLQTIGGAMAASNGYEPQQASELYITSGDFTDWAYGTHRIFAYTFEMFGGTYQFYPPGSLIATETGRNRDAVLYLLEQAGCPYEAASLATAHCANGRMNPPLRTWLPVVSTAS